MGQIGIALPASIDRVTSDGFYLFVRSGNAQRLLQNTPHITVQLSDSRYISPQQRKYAFAIMRDISIYTGHVPEEVEAIMKANFIARTGCDYFSLSNCSMDTANAFLTHLIDFCLEHTIATSESLLAQSPDIGRYLYACLYYKRCCITGGKAELHHVDTVGAGRNRKEIVHLGYHVLPLTRAMHTEAHTIGKDTFCKKYGVYGIALDHKLCQRWNVKG